LLKLDYIITRLYID